ncbi:unnamed protein product, partial [Rotaria magnacalcarata]
MLHLKSMHLTITIVFIAVLACIQCTTIKNTRGSKEKSSLSAHISDYKSIDNHAEINPISEGFIIINDHKKKQPPAKKKSNTPQSKRANKISKSKTLHHVTSTTCEPHLHDTFTSTSIITKTTLKITPKNTSHDSIDPPHGRRGRRLLNDFSYNTENETSSTPTPLGNDGDVQSFMQVDPALLGNEFIAMAAITDGSGETTEDTTYQTQTTSSTITTQTLSTSFTRPTTTAAQSTYETTAIPYTHMITTVTAESTPLTENPTTLTTGTGSTTHITVGTEMPTTPATVTETTTSITLGPDTTPTPATGTDTTTFVTDGTEATSVTTIGTGTSTLEITRTGTTSTATTGTGTTTSESTGTETISTTTTGTGT